MTTNHQPTVEVPLPDRRMCAWTLAKMRHIYVFLAFLGTLLCCQCGRPADEHWRDGNFSVYAIDTDFTATQLGFDFNPGTLGLVESEVIAAGSDSNVVVAKRVNRGDGSVEFFIVAKEASDEHSGNVEGPMTKEDFTRIKSERSLPDFSWRK